MGRWGIRIDPESMCIVDSGADADVLQELRRGAVARHLEGLAKRVLARLVLADWQPHPPRGVDRSVEVGQDRSGSVTPLERRGVDDRLERGASLTPGLRRPVE